MKRLSVLLLLATAATVASAGDTERKDCERLREEIAGRIEANGVRSYSLQIVAPDQASVGRIVGSCDGGRRQIVYQRLALGDAALIALLVPPEAGRRPHSESAAQDGL
jgi:hypothetical protein